MLWKKESHQPDAMYIDVSPSDKEHMEQTVSSILQEMNQNSRPEKSDAIALEKRNKGNEFFRVGSLLKAMELYNDSLRFAKSGSEHISLAYANRSACFLKMKMYDECLVDIELATKTGYPEHLRPKLNERKTRCLKEMQEDPHYPREKLSIEPDEKFPCLSNVAKIQRNDGKGEYSVVATKSIDVGQLIAIEDTYHVYVSRNFGIYCNICAKEFGNLVPCTKCVDAMFCPECQGHFLHEHECGLNVCEESAIKCVIMYPIRGILLALKMFATADELISFVEEMLGNPTKLPESVFDDRSKYQARFKCPIKESFKSFEETGSCLYAIYIILLRIPYVNEMFKTAKHRRFLMHLIGHHLTLSSYASGILPSAVSGPPTCIGPIIRSYIKHSCYPNIQLFISGGKCHWYSIKPIKRGEQLFFAYGADGVNSTTERKKHLSDTFGMKCECSRCQGQAASSAQRHQLITDPAYCYIDTNVKGYPALKLNSKQFKSLMDACVAILQKYGQMDWCDEIGFVSKLFILLYKTRSIGGGSDCNDPLVREFLSHSAVNISSINLNPIEYTD